MFITSVLRHTGQDNILLERFNIRLAICYFFFFLSFFSYSVIVQMVDHQREDTEKSAKTISGRELSWRQLCGVGRVNEHAAKVLSFFIPMHTNVIVLVAIFLPLLTYALIEYFGVA